MGAPNRVVEGLIPFIQLENLEFKCKYCRRTFHSCQALGGHQRAHKEARAKSKGMRKTKKRFDHMEPRVLLNLFYTCPDLSSFTRPEMVPLRSTQCHFQDDQPDAGNGRAEMHQAWDSLMETSVPGALPVLNAGASYYSESDEKEQRPVLDLTLKL